MEISPETSSKDGEKITKSVENVDKDGPDTSSEPETKANFNHYARVFGYSTPFERAMLGFASLTSIGSGIALPLMNVLFGKLVGNFTSFFSPGSTITSSQFQKQVNHNTLFIVYIAVAKFFLSWLSMFIFRTTSIRISSAIRLAYLQAIFAQSISSLDKLPPGQAASTITQSAAVLQIGISEKLSSFLQFTSLVLAAFIIAFTYSWRLTLVTSSALLFMTLVYLASVPAYIKMIKSMEHADSKATSIASEIFGSIRMIVACGAEGRVASRYAEWVQEGKKRGLKQSTLSGLMMAPIFFAMYCAYALTFWYGVKLYSEGKVHSVSTVVIVLMSCMMAVMSLGHISGPMIAASKAASAASSFFEVIDAPIPEEKTLQAPEVSAEEDIIFSDVTFAYPSRPKVKVHDRFNVCFEKGKITAVVGPSGSGKSTIVGLLEGWYGLSCKENPLEPAELKDNTETENIKVSGSITIGKHNLADINMKWWRSQIGLVEQNPYIFNDTIYTNVSFGLAGSKWEEDTDEIKHKLVEEACREAFADDFIQKLPLGYETQVGEGGLKLSGGQRQRLAIARSIIKRPSILILDEATSSIDVRGERIVQEALDRVSKNRTTITIAHRLSTIKKADKIVVMREGTVVEEGTHETLLAKNDGVYFGLVHAQQISMGGTLAKLGEEIPDDSDLIDQDVHALNEEKDSGVTEQATYQDKGVFNSIGTLLVEQHHLWKIYLISVLAAMGCGTGFPLQSYLFAQLVTVFEFHGQKLIKGSEHWSLMFFILAICLGVCYFTISYFTNKLSMHVSYFYRQQYFESIINKPIAFFDNQENSAGTLVSQLSNDPTQIQQLLGTNTTLASIGLFNIIGCIAISFAFGWKLSIIALVSSMPIIFLAGYVKLRYELEFEKMQTAVFADSSQFASEAIGAFRTVTSLTLEDRICTRYRTLLQGHVSKAVVTARFASSVYALADALPLACIAFVFWYGGKLLRTREYNATQFFIIYVAIMQGTEASGQWFSLGPSLAQASAAANRIFRFRDTKKFSSPISRTHEKQEGGAKLEFSDVYFKYPTRDTPIFTGLNLSIEKGEFAAIVGPSGCGKSTIIGLLERFYDIQSGVLACDGKSVADIDVAEYRSSISLVAQESTLFQGTIRENILLGVEADQVSEEQIHNACRDAEIHEFIISLPEGYGTDVGSKGVALSGGQKQRISIARALLRNPRILLLDEATSSLDSESEKLVQSAFERAGKGRTMVVVAHRLATIQNADVIFVLGEGNGRVVEKGNHAALLRARGVYWQMCQSQALDR